MNIIQEITQQHYPITLPIKFKQLLTTVSQNWSTYCLGRAIQALTRMLDYNAYSWSNARNTQGNNFYRVICALCATHLNQPINFHVRYFDKNTIAEDTTPASILRCVRRTDNAINITIVHSPYKKTILKQIIDTSPEFTRIKQIENYLICANDHFIRFCKIADKEYALFTSDAHVRMLDMLFVLLPHILNINLKPEPESENDTETAERNIYITAFNKFFTTLFNSYVNDVTPAISITALEDCINTFTALIKVDENSIQNFFTTVNTRRTQHIQRRVLNSIESTRRSIESYEQNLEECYRRLTNYNLQLKTFNNLENIDYTPLIKELANNKNIEILSTTPTNISLRVTAPLQYYIPEDFAAYERNPNSDYAQAFDLPERKLLHQIFVEQKYAFILQGCIELSITDSEDTGISMQASQNFSDYSEFPNPHLYHYNCWSRARTEIQKHLQKGDLELVIPQIIAAVQSVNVAEQASFYSRMLMQDLRNTSFLDKVHLKNNKTNEILTWHKALEELEKTPTYTQTVIEEESTEDENETN